MRDPVLCLLASRAILERQAQRFTPASVSARHAERALAQLTACIAITRATSPAGLRGKARLLLSDTQHGTGRRALAVSLLRDMSRISKLT